MRAFAASFLFVVAIAAPASGQAINPEFVHGREYTFERMVAERVVNDALDKGTIRLLTYVYRPLKNDRHGTSERPSYSTKLACGQHIVHL
jgi:hypothetical protein